VVLDECEVLLECDARTQSLVLQIFLRSQQGALLVLFPKGREEHWFHSVSVIQSSGSVATILMDTNRCNDGWVLQCTVL
jgi:hypothetical protein